MPESRILDAAMPSKPVAEGSHKSWGEGLFRNRLALADPALKEVMAEELHSEVGVIVDLSASEMRAAVQNAMGSVPICLVACAMILTQSGAAQNRTYDPKDVS